MSELAQAYYEERADRLGIEEMPPILSGQPWQLLAPEEGRISLQRPDQGLTEIVCTRYAEALATVGDFVLAGAEVLPDGGQSYNKKRIAQANNTHATNMVDKFLLPKKLQAGHVKDIRIEALAREEVQDPMYNQATIGWRRSTDPERSDAEAYFLTSGELYAGRSLGYTACLTLVHVDVWAHTPHYVGVPFNKNHLLAQSGLEQSRAVATYIAHWGVANAEVQPVRRGKRPRGTNRP